MCVCVCPSVGEGLLLRDGDIFWSLNGQRVPTETGSNVRSAMEVTLIRALPSLSPSLSVSTLVQWDGVGWVGGGCTQVGCFLSFVFFFNENPISAFYLPLVYGRVPFFLDGHCLCLKGPRVFLWGAGLDRTTQHTHTLRLNNLSRPWCWYLGKLAFMPEK